MKIIVTGGAGFIGSHLVRALLPEHQVLVIDNFDHGSKWKNLVGCEQASFEPISRSWTINLRGHDAVVHLGAISDTTHANVDELIQTNFYLTTDILTYCKRYSIPLIFASSASIYGLNTSFTETTPPNPLCAYAWTKALSEAYLKDSAVSLRFFNVYGPNEAHKGKMASQPFQILSKLMKGAERISLFYPIHSLARDFVYVDDVVSVIKFFLDNPEIKGVFNVGSGRAATFQSVVTEALRALDRPYEGADHIIDQIPMPAEVVEQYQPYTQADLRKLCAVGYTNEFIGLTDGMSRLARAIKKPGA